MTKPCRICNIPKTIDQFYKCRGTACKECLTNRSRLTYHLKKGKPLAKYKSRHQRKMVVPLKNGRIIGIDDDKLFVAFPTLDAVYASFLHSIQKFSIHHEFPASENELIISLSIYDDTVLLRSDYIELTKEEANKRLLVVNNSVDVILCLKNIKYKPTILAKYVKER